MTGRQFLGAQFYRHVEEILELDLLIAGHARDRRLAGHVAVGEARHHLFGEAALVIEDVVGDADEVGDAACILDVLTSAAGAFAGDSFPVVVKLERDADDVIALALQKRGDEGAVDTARHGDHDTAADGGSHGGDAGRAVGAIDHGGRLSASSSLQSSSLHRHAGPTKWAQTQNVSCLSVNSAAMQHDRCRSGAQGSCLPLRRRH